MTTDGGNMVTMGKQRRRGEGSAKADVLGQFVQAARAASAAEGRARQARMKRDRLAWQLHQDEGFTWRELASEAGISHVALLRAVGRVVAAEGKR